MKEKILTPNRIRLFQKQLLREEKSPATVEKYLRDVTVFRASPPDGL